MSGITGGLQNQISHNQREARAGTALALAASGLRYNNEPGKLSLALGGGEFLGQSGLAIGVGYTLDTRLRFNAALSTAPQQGDVGVVVGATWTLN